MRKIFWLCSLLLLTYFTLGLNHITNASITFDEGPHLAVGYTTLRTGDFRLQSIHIHPPLANMLAAAPLIVQDDLPDPRDISGWEINSLSAITDAVVWRYPYPARIATVGRLPILLAGVLLGALVYRWASDLGGRSAGLIALTLYAFDPNMIAHGSLITTDMVATFLIVATLYVVGRDWGLGIGDWEAGSEWQGARGGTQESAGRLLLIGLLLGLGQLAKVSTLMLVPVVGLLLFFRAYRVARSAYPASSIQHRATSTQQHPALRLTFRVLLPFLAAALVIWAGYGFEIAAVPGFPLKLPAATHVRIFQSLREHYDLGHPTFLQGQVSDHGWCSYFPIAFALKTPLPTLVLAAWALLRFALYVLRFRTYALHRILSYLSLWLFPILYAVSSLFSTVNIGYRHLLPVLPFLYISIGLAGSRKYEVRSKKLENHASRKRPQVAPHHASRVTFFSLVIWLVVGTFTIAPHYLTFFNELVDGAANGYHHLVDSNLDWGQNLWDLRQWMTDHDADHVFYAHYSPARLDVYGIDADFLPPDPRAVDFAPWNPGPGLYAIGATVLQGPYAPDANTYAWFRGREPDAVLGNALFVYSVPSQLAPEWAVLCTDAGISEETLKRNLGVSDLRILWMDCAQAQVYPSASAPGIYIIKDATLFVESHPTPLRSAEGETSAIVHFVAPVTPTPTESVREVRMDGPLTFLGHSRRETSQLWTYWRVERVPSRPLSLMAHLIGEDDSTFSVADGLGFPIEQWQPGDVIVQHHLLVMPEAPAPGLYTIYTGAYWLDTLERWTTADGASQIMAVQIELVQ